MDRKQIKTLIRTLYKCMQTTTLTKKACKHHIEYILIVQLSILSLRTGSHIVGCSGFRLFAHITALSAEGTYCSELLLKFFDVRVIQEEVRVTFSTVVSEHALLHNTWSPQGFHK